MTGSLGIGEDGARFFQAGGSLSSDQPTYVERAADRELFEHLRAGYFCYVLTARQLGKSSLRVRTTARLEAEGIRCATVDLTTIGQDQATAESWYYTLCAKLASSFKIQPGFREWWNQHSQFTPVARFSGFLEEVLLARTNGAVVIMIDEVDSMLSLDRQRFSTDDFFAAIRACYNARADRPTFSRLTFALFGVAAPDDLMADPARTPFNIGKAINLGYFEGSHTAPLLAGLPGSAQERVATLARIMHWTSGQPYLTQRVCQALEDRPAATSVSANDVDDIVQSLFLSGLGNAEANLASIESRVVTGAEPAARMLELYEKVLGGVPTRSSDRDRAEIYLRLSGLVVEDAHGHLAVANRIYRSVFDEAWISRARLRLVRPFATDVTRWLATDRAPGSLLRGAFLDEAITWSMERDDLTRAEKEYLEASRRNAKDEEVQRGLARLAKRLRRLVAGLVAALGLAVWQFVTARDLATERQDLLEQEKQLRSRSDSAFAALAGEQAARARESGAFDEARRLQALADAASERTLRAIAETLGAQRTESSVLKGELDRVRRAVDSLAQDTARLNRAIANAQQELGGAQSRLVAVRDSVAQALRSAVQAQSSMLAFVRAVAATNYAADDAVAAILKSDATTVDVRSVSYHALAQGSFVTDTTLAPTIIRDISGENIRVRLSALNALARGYWYSENVLRGVDKRLDSLLHDRQQPLVVRAYAALSLANTGPAATIRRYAAAGMGDAIAPGDSALSAAVLLATSQRARRAYRRYLLNNVPDDTTRRYVTEQQEQLVDVLFEDRDRDEVRGGEEEYYLSLLAADLLSRWGGKKASERIEERMSRSHNAVLGVRALSVLRAIRSRPSTSP